MPNLTDSRQLQDASQFMYHKERKKPPSSVMIKVMQLMVFKKIKTLEMSK